MQFASGRGPLSGLLQLIYCSSAHGWQRTVNLLANGLCGSGVGRELVFLRQRHVAGFAELVFPCQPTSRVMRRLRLTPSDAFSLWRIVRDSSSVAARRRGFTLVELLVVIAIIGGLIAL